MINPRYTTIISITALILAVVLIILLIIFSSVTDVDIVQTVEQPEYIEEVFKTDVVGEIDITIDQNDWEWLLENAVDEIYRSCDVTINGRTFHNVGIRPKGNSTLRRIARDSTTDRFSFKLDFEEYVEGQTCYGLSKIALNNIMSDKSYMREYLAYDLSDYLELPTPACAYTNITVNGQEWGLYLAVEVIEESFVQRQYGSLEGNLYKPGSTEMGGGRNNHGADLVYSSDSVSDYANIWRGTVFKSTAKDDYEKVIEMMKNLNDGTNLEKFFDVDEVLRYIALNTFLVNLDSYAGGMYHNYYLYEEDGIFQIIPWDFNLAFAGFHMTYGVHAINFPIDSPVTGSLEDAPLIGKLLEVPQYQELYHDYLTQIVDNYINSGVYENTIAEVDQLIDGYVENDVTSFYAYQDYKQAVPVIKTFGKDRAISITAQLTGKQPSTSYGNVFTTVDLSALGDMIGRPDGGYMGDNSEMANMPSKKNTQEIVQILGTVNDKELSMSLIVLIIALIFVLKFKRKRYKK